MHFDSVPIDQPVVLQISTTEQYHGRKITVGDFVAFATPTRLYYYDKQLNHLMQVMPFKPMITLPCEPFIQSQYEARFRPRKRP